ncbi:MAG: cell division protein FtsA [Bacteroidales bacterium]|nr:cell division protein FtsA [Bacteroidales bacterium]
MEERYIASVDLGSSKIALTVAKVSGDDIQVLFYREKPSQGIRNSAVFNPQKAGVPIREVIAEAEEELKIKILQVVVGLPRCDVRQESNCAKVTRSNPDESITVEEVEALKSIAREQYPLRDPEREQIYGAIAQSYSEDENFQLIENDIIGVISESFEGNFKLFIGRRSSVRTIDKVFNDLEIAVSRKYFTPGSIAKAVLTEDEMENGVALVDLGGGATSVSIYKGKILRHYACIPFGGKVITSDIRSECSITETLAENLKMAFGACQPDRLQNLGEKILQIEGDVEGYKQIPVYFLSEIITARCREIIDALLYEIERSGFADSLRSGIVITGGGAALGNLSSMVKDMSGYTVRTGMPRPLFSASGCPGVFNTSATTSIGMLLEAKADGVSSCIDAPVSEAPEAGPEYEEEPVAEEVQAVEEAPEQAVETPSALFSDEEVPKVEVKPESVRKPKKEHKLKVRWETIKNSIGETISNFYDKVNSDSDE